MGVEIIEDQSLDLRDKELGKEEQESLTKAIENNTTSITSLRFGRYFFLKYFIINIHILTSFINDNLLIIIFVGEGVGKDFVKAIASALSSNSTLTAIHFCSMLLLLFTFIIFFFFSSSFPCYKFH